MQTELHRYTVAQIVEGFQYLEDENRGLFGLTGTLVIQPEYQRNYIYNNGRLDTAVIESIRNKYPLGLLYFNQPSQDRLEVLDGQQRITSIGRFVTGNMSICVNGNRRYFDDLDQEDKQAILDYQLLAYHCQGQESEIMAWFKIINMPGERLNNQELLNAIYSGPFISAAKRRFSNTRNAQTDEWKDYIPGSAARQDYLETALNWASNNRIDSYLAQHRRDTSTADLDEHFDRVMEWVIATFPGSPQREMRFVDWGALHRTYGGNTYDPDEIGTQVQRLYADPAIESKKGIYEYILGGCQDHKLLNIRLFSEAQKATRYTQQTAHAREHGISNCPLCAESNHATNAKRIYKREEMGGDHVTAWLNGGETTLENCQMLCKTHNSAKGNN